MWLGHAGEGRQYQQLFDANLQAVVQVAAEEMPPQPPRELICCHFPVLDGAGNPARMLSLVVSTLATFLRLHIPTLVCCSMGRSRAPAGRRRSPWFTSNLRKRGWNVSPSATLPMISRACGTSWSPFSPPCAEKAACPAQAPCTVPRECSIAWHAPGCWRDRPADTDLPSRSPSSLAAGEDEHVRGTRAATRTPDA